MVTSRVHSSSAFTPRSSGAISSSPRLYFSAFLTSKRNPAYAAAFAGLSCRSQADIALHAGRGDRARRGRGSDLHEVTPTHAEALEALTENAELIVLTI